MRHVCLALTMAAVSGLFPSVVLGQGAPSSLSIKNYQYVSEQRISQSVSYVSYRADLVNTGPAIMAVTATVSSLASNIQVVPGQGNLHFAPVPANATVTSLDSFTILVDRTIAFDTANLKWSFLAPAANAGANRTAKIGDTVILDGSGSTNPSGYGTLSYSWKLTSTPPGSATVLYWYDTVKPQFKVDVSGNYVLTLVVSNGGGSDTATVTVSTTNTPPVANPGVNRTVAVGAAVTLNGNGSSDVDGDPLTYSWTMISRPVGSTAALIAANTVAPMFVVDVAGVYDIRLVVNDGKASSLPSDVFITTQNTAPVANAGVNQIQAVGALVQLDGSGSTDVDGDPLSYQWSLITVPPGSAAALSSLTAVKPTFTADRAGTYVAQLIVNDGKVSSVPATVQITTNPPLAPTASAGQNQTVSHRSTVHLSGSGTDPQGLALTFQWSLTTKPPLSTAALSSTTSANPTFVADLPGIYVAQLIVSNGILPSAPSLVTITTTNTPPVADAGLNQIVPTLSNVLLTGAASTDADGDPLTYAWSFTARPTGSTAVLSSATASSPSFFADVAGAYVIQLIVSDGFSSSNPATVTVTSGTKTITLTPNPLNLSTKVTGVLTVSLGSPAGPGGQIVALNSSDATIASIPPSVLVQEGMGGVNVPITTGATTGTASITALASGYTPGIATVNVAPAAVQVSLSAAMVGVTRTLSGVVTLTSPAPTGGVTVALADLSGLVSFQPASIPFAAGGTTATFTLTGVATGSTTVTAGAPGYNTGSVNVTVSMLGAITLLSNVTVGPGQSIPFPVSLVTGAPQGGATITLTSSDPAKVTISPSTVTVAQGASTPAVQPMVTGGNLGSADITASAPGFYGDTKTVQVAATLAFQQPTLTIGVNGTQNLTLNLSGPAPAAGLTVNISSSNTGVATVPPTVSFAPTKSSVIVPVTAIAVGTAVIRASALPGLADTTATVNVVNVGVIELPANTTVGLGQSASFPVMLPAPAPAGGVTVSLASSDTSKVTISPATITIAAGQTTPAAQPTITGVNLGAANISASAAGYSSATQPVQVIATLTFAQKSLGITGAATAHVLLSLSAAVPGGLTVNLTSSNSGVAVVPATVNFPPNAISVDVGITGVASGAATIHASATNIPDATIDVTVQAAGPINAPSILAVNLGQSVTLPVTLPAAATSPVTLTLTSSDPTRASVPPSVTIPAGQTAPATQPQVTGANIGTVTITSSAPGYASATTSVQVNATVSFNPTSLTISGTSTQNLTLTLSAPAPAGGLAVNVTSSNISVATVPATMSFAAGALTTVVPVTGVAAGAAVIHASNLPNIPDATASVTVQMPGTISLPANPGLGLGQTLPFPITLSAPAPTALTLTLTSSDPSKVSVSTGSVPIAQGATAPAQQPTITGLNFGSVSIGAAVTGYTSANATATVTGSILFTPQIVTFSSGGTQNLTLTLSGPAPAGGVSINLSSSNTTVGTVPASVTIPAGANSVAVPVSVVGTGSMFIHASNLPNLADTVANVTVQGSFNVPANLVLAPGQQTPLTITLGTPAPASGVTVLLSSSDSTKVRLVSGSVFVEAGQTSPTATPAVSGIDFGSATITISAVGFGTATSTIQVTGSASFFPSSLPLVIGAGAQNLSLTLSSPAPSAVTFTLTSSNPSAATVPTSVTIPINQNNVNVPVTPVGAGSTTITASTVTPNIASTTGSVTVTPPPPIDLLPNLSVGLGRSLVFPVTLATAPASNVTITLTSSNPAKLSLSTGTVTILAGQHAPAVQPQITGLDIGAVAINASAPGYLPAATAAQVTATITYAPPNMTIVGNTSNQFLISLSGPAPATGIVLSLSSSNPAVATVPPQQTFFPDGSSFSTLIIPVTVVGPGTTVIHAGATPYIPDSTANVTVLGTGTISLPSSVTLAPNQTATFPVTLGTPAPTGGVTVSLSSSDTSRVTITPSIVTVAAGQTTPPIQPTVTGGNYGAAAINASAPGYSGASAPVQVTTTMNFAPPTVTISGITTQNVALNLATAAPSSGLTVNLSSGNTNVATVPASVSIPGNASSVTVPITAVGAGSAIITAVAAAPGIPNASINATVVSLGSINIPGGGAVGLGQTVPFNVSLSSAPPSPVTILLASGDPAKVALSAASVTIPAGQTTPAVQPTISGVNFGTVNITATAAGYAPASSTVQVMASVAFAPPSLTFSGLGTENLTLTLSFPAPTGGVLINLVSTNPSAVAVPSTVTFTGGSSTVLVPVTGLALGSATIHASSFPNIPDAAASVSVSGAISLPANVALAPGQHSPFPVTLGSPAGPGGVTVALSSSDTSIVTLSVNSVFVDQGQTTPAITPTVTGVNFGSSTITASATGYAPVSASIPVSGAASFSPSPLTIVNGTGAQSVSLTLSVPAPTSVTFSLSSSNPSAASVPPSVTIPANQSNVAVVVTPVAPGSTTITASTATPNIPNATATVTVTSPGSITIPANLSAGLSTTVDFPVTLGTPAPAGGVTVTLSSSNPSILAISPSTVTIAAGQTTPATQPQVTGLDIGTVTMTAAAPGYVTANAPAQVNATASLAPTSLTILGTSTQNFVVTLSGEAPASGISVAASSSEPAIATVPAQVTFFPNGGSPSTAVLTVTGVAAGNTTIHVGNAPLIPDATADVTVLSPGLIGLPPNLVVGPTHTANFPITLGTPAPSGGVTVTLSNNAASKLTLSTTSVSIAEGQSTPATQPTVTGVDYGTATINATAPGYAPATTTVQVGATMTFAQPTVTINGITSQSVALNLSAPTPAGGLTINLASSNPAVATVPSSITFPANATTINVPISAVSLGLTTITASTVAPNIANATTNVTVQSAGAIDIPASATVGLGQTASLAVSLPQAASANVTVTLSSSDASKVTIAPGSVTIPAGQTTPSAQPTITGVNLGSANITAAAPGFTSGTTAVQVNATVNLPQGLTIVMGTGPQNLTLNLSAAAPVGGVSVNLSSSNPAAATVPSTVTFSQGQNTVSVIVTAVAPGTAVIHASSAPNIPDATATVTVTAPGTINLPSNATVGLGKSTPFAITLGAPAPSAVTINLTSGDTSKLTISPVSVSIAAGQTTPTAQPTITGVNLGTANISATAIGYTSASSPVQVTATLSYAPSSLTILGTGATQNLTLNLSANAPAGGLSVNTSSSNMAIATVPSTVTFLAGQSTAILTVTSVAPGSTAIHASSLPNIADATANVTVAPPATVNLPAAPSVGLSASAPFAVNLAGPAAADLTVALSSSDTSKVTISPSSITILAGQTAPATQPTITGVNLGSASISASGAGVTPASATAQVNATMTFAPPTATITGFVTQTLALNLSGAAPAGGLTVNLSSNTPGVATVPASVSFAAGSTSTNVAVTGVGFGTSTITASTAAPNLPSTTASVTVVTAGTIGVPSNPSVGMGSSTAFAVTLPQAAPSAVTVTLSSNDPNIVTISPATVSIAAGQTTPASQPQITGVKPGTSGITASAPGYTSSNVPVQVSAAVTFAPATLTISGFVTQNLSLTLSSAAPAGGLTINLSSSTPATATVPPTVTFPAGATSVTVPVRGVAFGTTVIHASALPNIADTSADVTVQSAGAIGVPASTSVGLNQSVTFAITLPAPVSAPVTVTISSSDPSKVAVSPGPFTIAAGATSPTTQPQVTGVDIGSVTITVSAAGYTSGTGAVQSNATVTFAQPAVTITGAVTQNITLNLSAPAPLGGLVVNLNSATPGVATVPGTVTFAQGATTASFPVTTLAVGAAAIHASLLPFIPDAATTVTVQSAGNVVVPASSNVNLGASAPLAVTLSAPAPSALTVTLVSGDSSKVSISPATVSIAQGATAPVTQPTITGVNIGSTNITASAPVFRNGVANVQVDATATFNPETTTITGLRTQNLTLTLSAPAPAAGVTVNLSSADTAVATVPATATFASGATTAAVPVTAVSLGSAVIHAGAAPFILDTSATVTVASAGPIGLPSGVITGLSASMPFAVTLPAAAPTGGVTVTLTSANPAVVGVTPGTVTIAGGQTTPASQPVVTGVNVGAANVSAAAPGYTTASQSVTVAASAAWPANMLATTFGAQNVTLTLSGTAPTGGISVNLSSTNTIVATVPSSVLFPAGANTVTVPVTALSQGSTVLHASGLNIPDSSATFTVTIPTAGTFSVNDVTIGQNLQTQLQINLSTPVTGGPLNVTLTSSDSSKLILGSLTTAGLANGTQVLQFPVGTSSGITYAQALAGSGTVTVTASAPGYTSGVGTITLTPSGFVIAGPTGVVGVPSFPTNVGNSTSLKVMPGRLDSSLNYVETQAIRGGFTIGVPLNSTSLNVGNLAPGSLTFTPADTQYSTTFTAKGVGSTLLSVTAPAGFSTPVGGANSITANVSPGGVTAPNLTVGQSLESNGQITLIGAPSVDTIVTLVSSDSSRLRFSINGTDAGVGAIPIPGCTPPVPDPTNVCKIVKIRAGQSHSPDIYFQALDSSGSATYSATVPSFGSATGTIAFQPSGIVIAGPFGLGNTFSVASGSAPSTLTVESAMLDATRSFVVPQPVASQVSVNVTSSNTSVGTITGSPVVIPAGSVGATTGFQPLSAGSSNISVNVPSGFSTPAAFGSVGATVSTAGIAITEGMSLGKFLQVQGNFALGAPAPAGGLSVTLTSNNPGLLLISSSPTVAGSTSIGVNLPAGGSSGTYYLQGVASSGTATYTVSAPGFAPHTGTITLTPSGIVLGDGVNPGALVFGNTVAVSLAQLDGFGNYMGIQQLAGGHAPVSIDLSTSVMGASITTPVTIAAGTDTASATLTGSGYGTVTGTTPPGFTDSNFLTVSIFF